MTVSRFLCRSIAVFSIVEKLFSSFHHIRKRAFLAFLKLKILLMIPLFGNVLLYRSFLLCNPIIYDMMFVKIERGEAIKVLLHERYERKNKK